MKRRGNTRYVTSHENTHGATRGKLSPYETQAIIRAYKLLYPLPARLAIGFLSAALQTLTPQGTINYLLGCNELLGGRRPLDVLISGCYASVFDDLACLQAGIPT